MKTNKSTKTTRVRVAIIAIASILLAGVVAFFVFDGPGKVSRYMQVQRTKGAYNQMIKQYMNPLSTLGIAKNQTTVGCQDSVCTISENAYIVMRADSATNQDSLVTVAKRLDEIASKNGWSTSSNSAKNFKAWMQAVTDKEDYSTDIIATKTTGDVTCSLQLTVAYSNPKPVAINTNVLCVSPNKTS